MSDLKTAIEYLAELAAKQTVRTELPKVLAEKRNLAELSARQIAAELAAGQITHAELPKVLADKKKLAELAAKRTTRAGLSRVLVGLKTLKISSDQQSINPVRRELLQLLDYLAFTAVSDETLALEKAINDVLLALPIPEQLSKLNVSSFEQRVLRLKIAAYLNLQAQAAEGVDRLSRKTVADNVASARGYCQGLTLLWSYIFAQAPELEAERFFHYLETILTWDEKFLETADELVFEKFFNHIAWLQSSHKLLGLSPAHKREAFEVISPDDSSPLVPDGSDKSPGQFSFVFTPEELGDFLRDFIQKDRMILLGASDHVTGVYLRNNTYYFYDSNSTEGHVPFSSLENLVEQIFKSHGVSQIDIPRYLALSIDSFRKPEQEQADYSFIPQWFEKNLSGIVRQATNNADMVLHRAAHSAHLKMIEKLLEVKANPNVPNKDGKTALHKAALNVEVVKLLLGAGAEPNASDNDGNTALHIAADNGFVEVVEKLAEKAELNAPNNYADTALHLAAHKGHLDVVKLLLASEADPNLLDNNDYTALLYAAQNGHLDVVKELLAANAIPDVAANDGLTAIHFAALNGHLDVVKLLLAKVADPNPSNNAGATPLHFAAQNGHLATVKLLLDEGAKPNASNNNGETALYFAAQNGDLAMLKLLLVDAKADPNISLSDGVTALHSAAQNGHLDLVKFLLPKVADPNPSANDGATPLHFAARNGHLDVVKFLLATVADPNELDVYGDRAILFAAQNGHLDVVKELLAAKAIPDVSANDGLTAIHFAAEDGHLEIVELLLDAGADPNAFDNDGSTALHLAAENGYGEVAKLLLGTVADANASDNDGVTPLHLAALNGHVEIVEMLLTEKVNPTVSDDKGITALHLAALNGHGEVVKLLLDPKAKPNPNASDNNGFTPLLLAAGNGHVEVVKLLLDAGADPTLLTTDIIIQALDKAAIDSFGDKEKSLDIFLYFYTYAIQDEQLSNSSELQSTVQSAEKTFGKNIKSLLAKPEFFKISQGSDTPLQKAFSLLQSYNFPTPRSGFFDKNSLQMQVKGLLVLKTEINSIEELLTQLNKIKIPEDDSFNAMKSFISLRLQPLEIQQSPELKVDELSSHSNN